MIKIKKYSFILMNLSNDIIFYIIDYSDKKEILKWNQVSKSINKYTNSNKFWFKIYDDYFNNYKFDLINQNWKRNFICISKLSKINFKILRKISLTQIDNVKTNIIYSTINEIQWITNDKPFIRNLNKIKIKTVVHNHCIYGYFITSIYLINYDELYLSVYFVNNSQSYDIFYKI